MRVWIYIYIYILNPHLGVTHNIYIYIYIYDMKFQHQYASIYDRPMFGCRYVYLQVMTEGQHQYTQSGHASLCEQCAISGHAADQGAAPAEGR